MLHDLPPGRFSNVGLIQALLEVISCTLLQILSCDLNYFCVAAVTSAL